MRELNVETSKVCVQLWCSEKSCRTTRHQLSQSQTRAERFLLSTARRMERGNQTASQGVCTSNPKLLLRSERPADRYLASLVSVSCTAPSIRMDQPTDAGCGLRSADPMRRPLAALKSWKHCAASIGIFIPERNDSAEAQTSCSKNELSSPSLASHAVNESPSYTPNARGD